MSHRYFEGADHARTYAQFRPHAPKSVADTVVACLKQKYDGALSKAIDVGCGSGQSTMALASHFQCVLGVDVSASQIEEAKSMPKPADATGKVEFAVSPAETLPLDDCSVQLVSAGVAYHYFDAARFAQEVQRVLQPNGVVAVYIYDLPRINHPNGERLKAVIDEFFMQTSTNTGSMVMKELRERYEQFAPFPEVIKDESCFATVKGTGSWLKGLVMSWSPVDKYYKKHGEDEGNRFVDEFCQKVLNEMGATTALEDTPMELIFYYGIWMSRKPQ